MNNALSNARHAGESFANYKARRTLVNKQLRRQLRGTFAHVSAQIVTLPALGVDPAADRAVIAGQYRNVSLITLPDGKEARRAVTKGVTFSYVRGRAAHREAVLAERRAR